MIPFWIETESSLRLAIVAKPLSDARLEEELHQLRASGVDILVSMLSVREASELKLSREEAVCAEAGISFRSFPVPDHGVPQSLAEFRAFVEDLRAELHAGKSVAVHCYASIGRSAVLLASLLCLEGWPADKAFERISQARGLEVPDTLEQVRWVERFAGSLRHG